MTCVCIEFALLEMRLGGGGHDALCSCDGRCGGYNLKWTFACKTYVGSLEGLWQIELCTQIW